MAIDFDKNSLQKKILMFRNKNVDDQTIEKVFDVKDNYQWKIAEQRETFSKVDDWEKHFTHILYRPFDIRHIYYQENIVFRTRRDVMHHMLEDNLGLIVPRQFKEVFGAFVTENLIGHKTVSAYDINYLLPLYLYKEKEIKKSHNRAMLLFESEAVYDSKDRMPNIDKAVYEKLNITYKKKLTPEEIFYYIYAVFYSNIYRERYAEFLKIDFPRVPFMSDYKLFQKLANLGNQIADLHLMKSDQLNKPISKYQGIGDNDRIEKIVYSEEEQRIYINKEKYFDNVSPELWNYQIGGYQVLQKYLKDRKNRIMDDPRYYCRVLTAIAKTIALQNQIDEIYNNVEKDLIDF